jgi:hypothetical protein
MYFFDYKADYKYDNKANGTITNPGEESTLYNGTREYDSNGNLIDQILFKRSILELRPNYTTNKLEIHAIITGAKHHPSGEQVGEDEYFSGESVIKYGDVFVAAGAAKSHSSVINPRIYVFNPQHRTIQRVTNTEVNSTSLITCPDHGLVLGASYGLDLNDNPTPIHMTSMTAVQRVVQDRQTARTLRKLYAVTGDSVANDPNTWTEDPAQTGLATPNLADFDSGQDEWDPVVTVVGDE